MAERAGAALLLWGFVILVTYPLQCVDTSLGDKVCYWHVRKNETILLLSHSIRDSNAGLPQACVKAIDNMLTVNLCFIRVLANLTDHVIGKLRTLIVVDKAVSGGSSRHRL